DSREEIRRVRGLFAYPVVVDARRNRLWAARGFFDRIIEVDLETFEPVRWRRIGAHSMSRAMTMDPGSGVLYLATFPMGDVFAWDPEADEVGRVGSCGWFCRSLTFDAERGVLIAGSSRGVFKIRPPAR